MAKDPAEQAYEFLAKDRPTVEEFKTLLKHVSFGVLAKRYLSSGLPFVFQDQPHKYLAFREAVGRLFNVPPQHIAVMGSARLDSAQIRANMKMAIRSILTTVPTWIW